MYQQRPSTDSAPRITPLKSVLTAAEIEWAGTEVTVPLVNDSSGSELPSWLTELGVVGKLPFVANRLLAAMAALTTSDWAERSSAPTRTPRKVGMAMAIRMAMMRRTTMSSIRVKPASSPSAAESRHADSTAGSLRLLVPSLPTPPHHLPRAPEVPLRARLPPRREVPVVTDPVAAHVAAARGPRPAGCRRSPGHRRGADQPVSPSTTASSSWRPGPHTRRRNNRAPIVAPRRTLVRAPAGPVHGATGRPAVAGRGGGASGVSPRSRRHPPQAPQCLSRCPQALRAGTRPPQVAQPLPFTK